MRLTFQLLLTLVFMVYLTGCSYLCGPYSKTEYITTEVSIPVVTSIPELPVFPELTIPYKSLTHSSTPKEKAEAFAQSIEILKAEIEIRDTVIDALRPLQPILNEGEKVD